MSTIQDKTCDIVVVGSGLAGLSAALSAAAEHASVLILEQKQTPGGVTAISRGIFNSFDPYRQHERHISDSPQRHWEETLAFGSSQNQLDLSETLCYEAFMALQWLQNHGVSFTDDLVSGPGLTTPRGHVPSRRECGRGLVLPLVSACSRLQIPILYGCKVISFSSETRGFSLLCQTADTSVTVRCKALILAAGGFAGNKPRLHTIAPLSARAHIPSASSDGRLLINAVNIGAQTVGEDFLSLQLIGRDKLKNRWLLQNDLPAPFGNPARFIAIDGEGRRFCREDVPVEAFLREALALTDGTFFLLASPPPWSAPLTPEQNGFACPTLSAVSDEFGIPVENLEHTVAAYNRDCAAKTDAFGKNAGILVPLHSPRWLIARAGVCVAATLGGLKTSTNGSVISRQGNLIEGLYAAGEIVGGIHGRSALPGNMLTAAAVFGIRSGRSAAKYVEKKL